MALVKTLVRRGRFNKWFDKRAAHTTNELYQTTFATPVTRKVVRNMGMSHVFWIEHERETVAAMMLSRQGLDQVYRVQGLTVHSNFRRQGYATALMETIHSFIESGATVYLCVDKDKPSTDWLVNWYRRLGFELGYGDFRLEYEDDEIPMKKLIK
jgi:ribosomal protein S18 acetylase RimI-like enzyme